jgi:hypothetical protein
VRLQEDGDADIFAHTSVKEDTLSRRGTFVGGVNRLANSVTHYPFNFGSESAVDRKLLAFRGRAERIQLRGLADGGGRWKRKTVEATVAREECVGRGGAESQLYGEAHRGGDVSARVEVRNALG